jgi:hypothetical protein
MSGTSVSVTVTTLGECERHPMSIVATNRQSKTENQHLVFMKHLSPGLAVADLKTRYGRSCKHFLAFDGKKAPSETEGAFVSLNHHP